MMFKKKPHALHHYVVEAHILYGETGGTTVTIAMMWFPEEMEYVSPDFKFE